MAPTLAPEGASLVEDLSAEIDRTLGALLPRGARVALVNFPNHANAGDSAVWLGAEAALRRLGATIVYRSAWFSYDRRALAQALGGDGTILINGGGNFGDLYPGGQQATRERVLADFQGTPTVQLPQSIWFGETANLDRVRRLCEAHGDLTLLVREEQSLAIARRELAVRSLPCPDMAFSLGPLARPAPPSVDVVWLARTDAEAVARHAVAVPDGVRRLDWVGAIEGEPRWPLPARVARRVNDTLGSSSNPLLRRGLALTFRPLARQWVARATAALSGGKAVVTDRLHGHVLALLLAIPHVVMDNSYGKIRATYESWTSTSPVAHFRSDEAEALECALALARGGPGPSGPAERETPGP